MQAKRVSLPTTFSSPGHSRINLSKLWRLCLYLLIHNQPTHYSNTNLQTRHKSFYPEANGPASQDAYSRIVSPQAYKRLKGLLDGTKGSIVFGGETDETSKFIAPTLVRDVKPDDSLMSESVSSFISVGHWTFNSPHLPREIFGPLLPIVPVEDLDEAIAFINARYARIYYCWILPLNAVSHIGQGSSPCIICILAGCGIQS